MKKKVLLISPITEEHTGIENFGDPAIGVHRIASYLRVRGHYVRIYDCNIDPPFEETYQDKSFDVIGISILAETLIVSLKFIRKLREGWPEAKIIAGGIEASLNYQAILDNSPCDAVCLAEGEDVMLQICDGRVPFHSIPGLVIKNKAIPITNDSLWGYCSRYDFSKTRQEEYWGFTKKITKEDWQPVVRLVTSSHCLRKCSFCSVRLWHEQACGEITPVAYLSPEQVETLLQRIKEQLPETEKIYFCEDNLLVTRKRAYDLIPILKKFSFQYLIQTATWMLTEDIVKKLAEAGIVHITCGVENASSYVRDSLNKHQDDKRIEDIIDWCNEAGIRCYYLIILFTKKTRIEDLWINYITLTRWMEKGIMISVEPFEHLYRGSLDYDSDSDSEYEIAQLNGHSLKRPTILLPDDPEVRNLLYNFRERWPYFKEGITEAEGQKHFFKGATGKWMIELLGKILNQRHKNIKMNAILQGMLLR